jgi:hypothetical protein
MEKTYTDLVQKIKTDYLAYYEKLGYAYADYDETGAAEAVSDISYYEGAIGALHDFLEFGMVTSNEQDAAKASGYRRYCQPELEE